MPFKSKAQRRFMYARKPKLAKEFEKKTSKGKKLPEKVKKQGNDTGTVRREKNAKHVATDTASSAEAHVHRRDIDVEHRTDPFHRGMATKHKKLKKTWGD